MPSISGKVGDGLLFFYPRERQFSYLPIRWFPQAFKTLLRATPDGASGLLARELADLTLLGGLLQL